MLSDALKTYARELLELHALIRAGRGDSDAADEVRERMDGPWGATSDAERRLLRVLSADLYDVVQDAQQAQPAAAPNQQQRELLRNIASAGERHDWAFVLQNLRAVSGFLNDPAMAAFMRGRAWLDLGDADVAVVFLEAACRLNAANVNYQYLMLDTLWKSRQAASARQQVAGILTHPAEHHSRMVAKAADLRFLSTREMPDNDARHVYRELLAVYEPLVARLRAEAGDSLAVLVQVLVLRGMCFEHLDQPDAARQCYDEALRVDPQNEAALTARGLLLYGASAQAIDDLAAACRQNTPLVWPYLFLAHHAVTIGDYRRCAELCVAGLDRSPTRRAAADLFEWLAICQASLGAPVDTVRASFQHALELAPTNQRIQSNLAAFERAVSGAEAAPPWTVDAEQAVRDAGRREFMFALAA